MKQQETVRQLRQQLVQTKNPARQVELYLDLVKAVTDGRRNQTLTDEEALGLLFVGNYCEEILTAKSGTTVANTANEIFELALFELDTLDPIPANRQVIERAWSKIEQLLSTLQQ